MEIEKLRVSSINLYNQNIDDEKIKHLLYHVYNNIRFSTFPYLTYKCSNSYESLNRYNSGNCIAISYFIKLFLKTNTDTGETLTEINKETKLKVGDLVTVRIELRSDRNMEFIHMKDMRASGVEPINVLSAYKWQDNLGYYSHLPGTNRKFLPGEPRGHRLLQYQELSLINNFQKEKYSQNLFEFYFEKKTIQYTFLFLA